MNRINSYSKEFFTLYDDFYKNKEYAKEASFIRRLIPAHDDTSPLSLLDIACGTGGHAFELEKLGLQVTATDVSSDAIHIANRKKAQLESQVSFSQQDMKEIQFNDHSFDIVTCLFDSIGFALHNEGISQTLSGVSSVLKPGGYFIFEFWHAPAMSGTFDPVRVTRHDINGSTVIRISETSLHYTTQSAVVRYSIIELCKDGTYKQSQAEVQNRFFHIPEIEYYLSQHHMKLLNSYSGFDHDSPITRDTWHIVCLAEKLQK